MAIQLQASPKDWGRVWDTNRLNYRFYSTNWQKANFNFLIVASRYNITTSAWVSIGTFYMYPLNGGTMNFNPSIIYRNYLSSDVSVTSTTGADATNSATQFKLDVYEYYSDTTNQGLPYKHEDGSQLLGTTIKLFNGAQGLVAYDDLTYGPGNAQWVMSGSSSGLFLTDANQYRLDSNDKSSLYFLADPNLRPTRVRFTIYYWYSGGAVPDGPLYTGGQSQSTPLPYQSLINQTYLETQQGDWTGIGPVGENAGVRSATTYLNLTYSHAGTLMYYFPMGPVDISNMSLWGSANISNWLYYKIDLLNVNTQMNKSSFWVIKQDKCSKYEKWQMMWLNPHGGYDNFTFNMKTIQRVNVQRGTYKQRLLPTQTNSAFQAGERVFNTQVIEETLLQSDSINQQESQLLIQMAKSPIVYAIKRYNNNGAINYFLVPYIVTTQENVYKQKINDKFITFEIGVRPANETIIQQN